jgi:WXG100 family type VII secretion target
MTELITYNYSTLQQAVQDIFNIVNNINGELDNLGSTVQRAMSNWTGGGATQYHAAASSIQGDVDNLNMTLQSLSNEIDNGAQNFQSLDNKVASSFQFS